MLSGLYGARKSASAAPGVSQPVKSASAPSTAKSTVKNGQSPVPSPQSPPQTRLWTGGCCEHFMLERAAADLLSQVSEFLIDLSLGQFHGLKFAVPMGGVRR